MDDNGTVAELLGIVAELKRLVDSSRRPSLLTQQGAAQELSISLSKLKSYIRVGLVSTVRIGGSGHPMIAATEIDRLIAEWTEAKAGGNRPARQRRSRTDVYDARAEAEQARRRLRERRKSA